MKSLSPSDYGTQFLVAPVRSTPRPDWVGHIPFAQFLIEKKRPSTVVELGVFHGDSFCAFCQASRDKGIGATVVGVDTWEGDIHTGNYPEMVYRDLKDFAQEQFGSAAQLRRSLFEDEVGTFEDASVDVLHIDGEHTYEAVSRDFNAWVSKVKDDGIILLHDTDVFGRPEFGVWKFWDEISPSYKSYRFSHCNGLGVLTKARSLDGFPPALQALFDQDHPDHAFTGELFSGIGSLRLREREWEIARDQNASRIRELASEAEQGKGMAAEASRQLEMLDAKIQKLDAKVQKLHAKTEKLKADKEALRDRLEKCQSKRLGARVKKLFRGFSS